MAFRANWNSASPRAGAASDLGAADTPIPQDPSLEFSECYEPEAAPAPAPATSATLPPRLERLIEIVGEHFGFSPSDILDSKAFARRDPAAGSELFSSLYRDQVAPERERRENPLPKAMSAQPDRYCFLYMARSARAVVCVPRLSNPALALYHGKALELVPGEDSPFSGEPDILIGSQEP